MISDDQEEFILSHAYIPEHSVHLMAAVSEGQPFLMENYLCFQKEDWMIVVGYPLNKPFLPDEFEEAFEKMRKTFQPRYASVMAPEVPPGLRTDCRNMEKDAYYMLDPQSMHLKADLKRAVKKTSERLRVERSDSFLPAHRKLMQEFLERVKPEARVKELLLKMPDYVQTTKNALVLNAWEPQNRGADRLAAFFVIDLEPRRFSTYVIGCRSTETYAAGASDLLMSETVRISRERGKDHVHLGFGVNPGIRRFKQKWGGVAGPGYEMCDLVLKKPSVLETLLALGKKIS